LFAGIYLTLFDLLGTVIIFLDVFFYALFNGFDKISGKIIVLLLFIAIIAETVDFLLVMKRAHQPAITRKTFWIAAASAIAGAFIVASFWGGPGVWGGFFLGGFAAIMILEIIRQKKLKLSYRVSRRALIGMGGRKFFKGLIALFMITVSLSNIYS